MPLCGLWAAFSLDLRERHRDLIPQFGSESGVSMFMTGQRNLTLEQVRKLSIRFKLPADAFIPKGSVKQSAQRLAKAHSRSR